MSCYKYFYFFLLSGNAFAQMTLPSVFPDMKSINPAVISLRKSGMIKLAASQDQIEKKQTLKTHWWKYFCFEYEDSGEIECVCRN